MSKKASATFDDTEYAALLKVAKYQHRTVAGYIVHCVKMENHKRIKAIEAGCVASSVGESL